MAAFGTKKRNGDVGVERTFPAVFQTLYSQPLMYFPVMMGSSPEILVGHDFQSEYHEEKRREAHQSVRNGLQARRTANRLLLTGPHNYHLPKPVLGERQFANPMCGVVGFSSARQDGSVSAPFSLRESGLTGGVLRTAEGQGYIQRKRMERIEQLNRIDALAMGAPVAFQQAAAEEAPITEKTKIEFNLLRQQLLDDLTVGKVTRFTYDSAKRMLEILFRYAPRADAEELEDILAGFDSIVQSTEALVDSEPQDELRRDQEPAVMETLDMLMKRAREYTVEMTGAVNRSTRERIALSKALVNSLGFKSLFRTTATEALEAARRRGVMNARERQEDDDDDGDDAGPYPRARGREDDEQDGAARAPLAGVGFDGNQRAFGANAGRYLPDGGGEEERPAFFEPLGAPAGVAPDARAMDREAVLRDVLRLPGDASPDAVQQAIDAEWGGREDDLEAEVERRLEERRAPARAAHPFFVARAAPPAAMGRTMPRADFQRRTASLDAAREFARELGVASTTERLGNLRRYLLYTVLPQRGIRLTD